MPFIANSTYYFDIFFEDKNLSYDAYYSKTNPTNLDLSNPTYLKKIINLLRISLFKRRKLILATILININYQI